MSVGPFRGHTRTLYPQKLEPQASAFELTHLAFSFLFLFFLSFGGVFLFVFIFNFLIFKTRFLYVALLSWNSLCNQASLQLTEIHQASSSSPKTESQSAAPKCLELTMYSTMALNLW